MSEKIPDHKIVSKSNSIVLENIRSHNCLGKKQVTQLPGMISGNTIAMKYIRLHNCREIFLLIYMMYKKNEQIWFLYILAPIKVTDMGSIWEDKRI